MTVDSNSMIEKVKSIVRHGFETEAGFLVFLVISVVLVPATLVLLALWMNGEL